MNIIADKAGNNAMAKKSHMLRPLLEIIRIFVAEY